MENLEKKNWPTAEEVAAYTLPQIIELQTKNDGFIKEVWRRYNLFPALSAVLDVMLTRIEEGRRCNAFLSTDAALYEKLRTLKEQAGAQS